MKQHNLAVVKTLTYAMFAMFAMTTDSVGLIIPEIVRTFQLSLTAAGTFQYATMAGIADGQFLILPHPEVAGMYAGRAAETDRWLRGMNRLQQGLEAAQ